jgi:uncharacterized membrane protein
MDLVTIPGVIAGYILILFVPGYALTWALYSTREELDFIERIALSFVLSIVSVMISVLFADIFLGIDVTPPNIVIVITIVTALAALAWLLQVTYAKSRLKLWIDRKLGRKPEGIPQDRKDSESVREFWNIR